jgi:hypothetical protein
MTNTMEIDDAEPPSASPDHDMEDVTQQTKQSAEPSTTHQRSSWAEMRRGKTPDHMSDTSNSEDTEMRELHQAIDEDAGGPESAQAVSAEVDELADELDRLGVASGWRTHCLGPGANLMETFQIIRALR